MVISLINSTLGSESVSGPVLSEVQDRAKNFGQGD